MKFLNSEKLWEHQNRLVEFAKHCFQEFGYSFWISGMTTGKTAASLKVMVDIDVPRVLVLTTKASVKQTWPKQVPMHTEGVAVMAVTDDYGSSARKAKAILDRVNGDEPYLIVAVNYDTAKLIGDTLAKCNFNMVIADECHRLKSHTSQTLKVLAKACSNIPAKIAMTGTAFEDRPIDVFGQVAFLDPLIIKGRVHSNVFGHYTDFFDAYVNYYVANNIKIPNKANPYKNLDKMMQVLNPFTIIINTEDVVDLPPYMDITRVAVPSKEHRRMYDEMRDELVTHLDNNIFTSQNVLTQSLRLAQMTGGYAVPYHINKNGEHIVLTNSVEIPHGDCKLQELLSIMEEVGNNEVVIFTRFTEDVTRIREALTKAGYKTLELTGRLHEHVEFQEGKADVLVANESAGSESVDLTIARYVIFYSIDYSRTKYLQARYRCRRANSDKELPITYFHIVMEDSIDETLLEVMNSKEDVASILHKGLTNRVKRSKELLTQ